MRKIATVFYREDNTIVERRPEKEVVLRVGGTAVFVVCVYSFLSCFVAADGAIVPLERKYFEVKKCTIFAWTIQQQYAERFGARGVPSLT